MSVHTTPSGASYVKATCDNPACNTAHRVAELKDLPGLLFKEVTLVWADAEVHINNLYICKGSCTGQAVAYAVQVQAL